MRALLCPCFKPPSFYRPPSLLQYFRDLDWNFPAEVLAIVLVEIVMAALALRKVQPLWTGVIPVLLYPGSIALVAILQSNAVKFG